MNFKKINNCYILTEKIIEKDNEGKYYDTGKIEKTTIFLVRDDEGRVKKIHLQNYLKLIFAQEWRIEKDNEYCFKIMNTKIKAIDIEKFLDDGLDNWSGQQEFFVHRLVEKAEKLQNYKF